MGLAFTKELFNVQNHSSRPKIDPCVNFSNFQTEENLFSFPKCLRRLDEKRAAATPPDRSILLKIGQNMS